MSQNGYGTGVFDINIRGGTWSASARVHPGTCHNSRLSLYIHTHTYVHTCIHAYLLTYMHTCILTYVRTHTYTSLCPAIHTYVRTYTHAYKHTYIQWGQGPGASVRVGWADGRRHSQVRAAQALASSLERRPNHVALAAHGNPAAVATHCQRDHAALADVGAHQRRLGALGAEK